MICPHCLHGFHDQPTIHHFYTASPHEWYLVHSVCPGEDCGKLIVRLRRKGPWNPATSEQYVWEPIVYPRTHGQPPCPPIVKDEAPDIAKDYEEACYCLQYSSNAAGALARRCLQNILRNKGGWKATKLYEEIESAINSGKLPSYITDGLHTIRKLATYAAHPLRSDYTGQILDATPEEVERTVAIIQLLFDFYWVEPSRAAVRDAEIDRKYKEAERPPKKPHKK